MHGALLTLNSADALEADMVRPPTTRLIVTRRKPMPKRAGLTLVLGAAVVLVTFAKPAGAIDCVRGLQRVNGQMIYTPYCRDEYLADVARQYGFKASAAKLRNNPNFKKEICRFVFEDIRVQITCLQAGVPEYRR